MSETLPVPTSGSTFERIKRTSESGDEFWSARELARVLEYSEFRHFQPVIEKAREACLNSNHRVEDHFEQILDMVAIGSGAQRPVEDWKFSRYACYLIIQNADPSKPLVVRQEMKTHNKKLAGAAKEAGVIQPLDYAIFTDHGYQGLYGGLGMRDIHRRKRLKPKEQILDHMGSTELAANLFRTTQAEDKLRREKVRSKDHANQIHKEVGQKVRQTIRELGGTMPEHLPKAESIKKVESREKKRIKAEDKKPLPGQTDAE
jgi:DNA-damage-inducible protein D